MKRKYILGVIQFLRDNKLVNNPAFSDKDAGVLKCTATNNKGIASTSGTLHVEAEAGSGISTAALHPSGQAGLEAIEKAIN